MRIWTIQPVKVLTRLDAKRVLYVAPARVPGEFRHAYDWMRQQMKKRIPGYKGRYPWWGWYSPCPDLRCSGHLPKGTRGARLELDLDPDKALLSDFDAWHAVLNRAYLALSEEEDEAWYQALPRSPASLRDWPLPEPWQSEMLASWERIFDLNALAASDWSGTGPRHIQVTFETLRLADVRRCKPFLAR